MRWAERRAMKRQRRKDRRHNSLDFGCVRWVGDMRPLPDDPDNRWFGGDSRELDARRCLVCRPYPDLETLRCHACQFTVDWPIDQPWPSPCPHCKAWRPFTPVRITVHG